jgi:regulator of CtrA degradation
MTDSQRRDAPPPDEPVVFGRRLAGSETFKVLFRDGMALVEEAANYLDGDGRDESKDLTRAGGLAYAAESMRLTSRLMQLASWLLLQRAVNEGEMQVDQARQERAKVRLRGFDTGMSGPGWDDLPERLRVLIERSIRLQERIRILDEAIYLGGTRDAANPVAQHFGRLAAAFGAPLGRGPSDR